MACLDEPAVLAFVAGRVTAAEAEAIDDHLAACRTCRDLVVWAAQTTLGIARADAPTEPAGHPDATEVPDRYAITALIGVGGQGLVYAADDAVLGRQVALKVLRPDPSVAGGPGGPGGNDASARDDRILREARLVARLSHPNIVAIYDAGTTRDGAIYLAMELVAGGSLSAWLAGSRSNAEILRTCIDVGRGVAAAHEAGIVHRDIKPANILIGADHRARVTDFGLALDGGELAGNELAGTLAYMAPEQLAGRPTLHSDQFSLAVMIWEAFAGTNPFDGATIEARKHAIAAGPPSATPARMPGHVARALRKAMTAEPSARHAGVAVLVDLLADDPRARRSRRILLASLALATIAAGSFAFAFARRSGPSCSDLGQNLRGVWDDDARARLTRGFAKLPEPYAAVAAVTVRHLLDDYADAWVASRGRACEATVESTQVLREQCLDERTTALAAAVRTLSTPDREIAQHAVEIASGLPALAPCDNVTWLQQRVRPPTDPTLVAKVAAVDALIAEAATTLRAGKIKPAIEIAQRAALASAATDHPPTRAHAALVLGQALSHLPDNVAAEASLEQAAQWAQRGRDDRAAAEAWIELVKVIGHGLGRFSEALRHAEFADATLARLGDAPDLRATLDYHRCAVEDQAARFAEANAACAAARQVREATFGATDPLVADVLILQARLATNQNHYPDAVKLAQHALAIREAVLGKDHPALCEALFALGQVQLRLGQLDAAGASYERAMALARPTFGEDSAVMGSLWAEQAVIAMARGDLATALAEIDRSTAIRERLEGATHVDLVFNLTQRARILEDLGKQQEAVLALARAQQIAETALGPDHPSLAAILQDIGRLHGKLGDRKLARAELDRAIAIATKTADKTGQAAGESALAEFLHGGGAAREALPHYEHALATYEALFGVDAPQLVATLENLGLAHIDVKEPALALAYLDRAIAIETKLSGASSVRLLLPLSSLGDAQLALHRRAEATATWQRAVALPGVDKQFPEDVADLKQRLAKLGR